ncbi:phosphodiesterase [Manganibacter manganicus]|uniref:Phosphodiesterase n=1 Tax=Manganibacter manganicus TaxID=1873176 RepID=A0A1V8RVK4_9HYPH|nr:phosphodiesterase [Pseudaminobacter manganicus]OQM77226.1 phosphodiesterase [Pseudaminobacter manganicus]
MLIAQISDFHIRPEGQMAYAGLDTNAMARRAVATITALDPAPDCVLVTGDLADCGRAEEYEIVADILSTLPMPVFVIPGNHDRRETMRDVLAPTFPYLRQADDFLHYAIEDFPVRLIGLDTVLAGEDGGAICAAREAWFAARLAEGDGQPTLVFMHHPPFRVGVSGMDIMMCDVGAGFSDLIRKHAEIERVTCGHYHRPITTRYAGTIGLVAPGIAHQVALDLRPGEPNRFIMEPPGFALHAWAPETGLITHIAPIGNFGPSRDFVLDTAYPGKNDQ